MGMYRTCAENYWVNWKPCPCHPEESEVAFAIAKKVIHKYIVKSLQKLARQIVDDELILSESIIE
jgi:hypothetical protein